MYSLFVLQQRTKTYGACTNAAATSSVRRAGGKTILKNGKYRMIRIIAVAIERNSRMA